MRGPLPGVISGETGSIIPQEEISARWSRSGVRPPAAPSRLSSTWTRGPSRIRNTISTRRALVARSTGWGPSFPPPPTPRLSCRGRTLGWDNEFLGQVHHGRIRLGANNSPWPPLANGVLGGWQFPNSFSCSISGCERFFKNDPAIDVAGAQVSGGSGGGDAACPFPALILSCLRLNRIRNRCCS